MIRRLVPYLLLPLGLLACGLASSPWLRAFPSSIMAVPLIGAAVLSVLVPVVAVGVGLRRLWLTALIDLVGYLFFTTLVALHEPVGFPGLYRGLVHGPAQILSFALPLVGPRTLLVAPVTLCWISGTILGESIGRAWHSVLPYAALMATFTLAYAGSVRGVTTSADGRRYDTLLAGALLLVLLLMRAVEAWIEQDLDAESAQPDGMLPLRGLVIGVVVSVVVAGVAATVVTSAFSGPPTTPARTPPLAEGRPVSPVAFVAGLRPNDPGQAGRRLFTVATNRQSSGYFGIADVDSYDGDGWGFQRTFRPSGGVIPADTDSALRGAGRTVTQQYTIAKGPLTSAPWLPSLYRPQRITGISVDVDSTSAMLVAAGRVFAGEHYTVTSAAASTPFADLSAGATVSSSTPAEYTLVPNSVGSSLDPVVTSFENETGVSASTPVVFLQALARDLQRNYVLAGGSGSARLPRQPPQSTPRATASGSPQSSSPPTPAVATGGTGFANVLASILGPDRAATPEQYATLVALMARQVGVPARLTAGFRVGTSAAGIPAGTYPVTAADARTWVEIPVVGHGWVVLDPSPARYGTERAKQSTAARPTPSRPTTPTPNGLATQSDRGHAVAPPSTVPQRSATRHGTAILLAVVIAVVGLGLLLALLLRKRWRARRRQRSGDPRRRLLGAWHEALDVLAEAGLPDPANLTCTEVVTAASQRFGAESGEQARYLGERANVAIFSPSSWIDPAEADAAWHAQARLRRSIHGHMTLGERIGSGLRYRRVRRPRTPLGPPSWAATSGWRPPARRRRGRHSERSTRR